VGTEANADLSAGVLKKEERPTRSLSIAPGLCDFRPEKIQHESEHQQVKHSVGTGGSGVRLEVFAALPAPELLFSAGRIKNRCEKWGSVNNSGVRNGGQSTILDKRMRAARTQENGAQETGSNLKGRVAQTKRRRELKERRSPVRRLR
jgi:hypothetical protein